jgi:hypothetical protein
MRSLAIRTRGPSEKRAKLQIATVALRWFPAVDDASRRSAEDDAARGEKRYRHSAAQVGRQRARQQTTAQGKPMKITSKALIAALAALSFATSVGSGFAQTKPATTTETAKPSDSPPESDLTPEEKAERDQRKACKVAICSAFRSGKADGADVSCDVIKSWRKEQMTKLISKLKVSWPYEGVRCTSKVAMRRADLLKSMSEPKHELQLDTHAVACTVARDKDEPTKIAFDFAPKVWFEGGKATKAKINWGKIDAPTLIKSGMWTATAADNTVNILSGTLVKDINDFITTKCDEVKSEWAK